MIRMEIPVAEIPLGVPVAETTFEERQKQKREVDRQRKEDDPTFKGAFHEKKKRPDGKKKLRNTTPKKRAAGKR
jgi:ATP-dependent RNA helicase RhlE